MSYLWRCKHCNATFDENRYYVYHRQATGHDRTNEETDTGPFVPAAHGYDGSRGKAHPEVQAAAMLKIQWDIERARAKTAKRRAPEPPAGLKAAKSLLKAVEDKDEQRMQMALKAVRDAGLVDTPPPGLPELFEMISPREPSED